MEQGGDKISRRVCSPEQNMKAPQRENVQDKALG